MRAPYRLGTADIGELNHAAGYGGCYIPEPDARPSIVRRIVAGFIVGIITMGATAILAFGVVGFTCLIGLACLSVGG